MWGQMQGVGSPLDLSSIASSSENSLEDLDLATSPGADLDLRHSLLNTPANTSRAISEEVSEAALVSIHGIVFVPGF